MTSFSRRRAITIFGAAAGAALLAPAAGRRARAAAIHEWQGVALGAPARIVLAHPDRAAAEDLFAGCEAEIRRLEDDFSLNRDDSALARLNRDGALADPSPDMVRLLGEAQRFAALTDGAFDVTVQPLWTLYADHFAEHPDALEGPDESLVAAVRARVGWRGLEVGKTRIAFARPGMAATLNGIAQGYITDRIADRLRADGIANVLVDLGETRGVGRHPDGRPWAIGLADPFDPSAWRQVVELVDRAVATSGGYGTRFSADGRFHHLFEPATGHSANRHVSASVLAPTATTADALSTALFVAPDTVAERIATTLDGIAVYLTAADGTVRQIGA